MLSVLPIDVTRCVFELLDVPTLARYLNMLFCIAWLTVSPRTESVSKLWQSLSWKSQRKLDFESLTTVSNEQLSVRSC